MLILFFSFPAVYIKYMARRLLYHNRKSSDAKNRDVKERPHYRYQLGALSLCGTFLFFYVSGLVTFRRHPLLPSAPHVDYKSIPISRIFAVPPSHMYREDGLLEVNYNATHPLLELIDRSEDVWASKHMRASRTLDEAIMEYERRYNRLPPVGFELWYVGISLGPDPDR